MIIRATPVPPKEVFETLPRPGRKQKELRRITVEMVARTYQGMEIPQEVIDKLNV